MKNTKKNESSLLKFNQIERLDEHKIVSYSQYTKWANCPKQWKLTYIDKHKLDEPNIHLIFGTAMHETIQHWLDTMYSSTIKEANNLDLDAILLETMKREFISYKERTGDGSFTSSSQMMEFYYDGVGILNFLKKKRGSYFSTKTMRLVGIELPIYYPVSEGSNVHLMSYLDLVFEMVKTGDIEIWDIKTSTNGWNKFQKQDKTKTAQLLLYKRYFAKQYNYTEDKIRVKYFIVKRRLYEDLAFPQKRVQEFSPAQSDRTINSVEKDFNKFIESSFNKDGSYKTNGVFPAMAGNGERNCRFCPFKESELCPKEERITHG